MIGHDLSRDTVRTFKVSRIRGDIRFATRRERDFRVPTDFDVEQHRIPRPWQIGETVGTARIAVSDDTAWWVERTLADAGTVEDESIRDGLRAGRSPRKLGPSSERTSGAARAG